MSEQDWQVARRKRDEGLAAMVADLDRCVHGRHRGDVCLGTRGCGGPSVGNLLLPPGTVIGHDISGRPYTVPERTAAHRAVEAWLPPRPERVIGSTCQCAPRTGYVGLWAADGWPCSHRPVPPIEGAS